MPPFNPAMIGAPSPVGRGGGGSSDTAIGSVAYLASDPGPSYAECNGQSVSITDAKFPFSVPAGKSAAMYVRPDPLNSRRSQFYWISKFDDYYIALGVDESGYGIISKSSDLKTYTFKDFHANRADTSLIPRCAIKVGNVITVCGYAFQYSMDNGETWNNPVNVWANSNINKIVYGNGRWVAVSGAYSYVSTDGINFSRYGIALHNQTFDVAFAGGVFVAVGSDGNGGSIVSSSDGMTWTQRVGYGDQQFIAVASRNGSFMVLPTSSSYWYSSDGLNWIAGSKFVSGSFRQLFAVKDYWAVVDDNGTLYATDNPGNWSASNMGINVTQGNQAFIRSKGAFDLGGGQVIFAGDYTSQGLTWGWYCRVSVGNSIFSLPDIAARQLKSGKTARPYMRIAA